MLRQRTVERLFVGGGLLLLFVNIGQTISFAGLEDISAQSARTTVYVSAPYIDPMTKDLKDSIGSGVLITEDGDILTDYHVIKGWLAGTSEQKQNKPLVIRIGSKFGNPQEVSFEGGDEHDDFAVLKILNQGAGPYPYAPICFSPNIQPGSFIFAFGYPNNRELSAVPGTFNNANGDDNRWTAAVPVTYGMSGGPVYNEAGYVVALVNSGIDPTTSLLTPLRWARSVIENKTSARPSCYKFCRTPENGVESWGLTSNWSDTSDWLSGGHSQNSTCQDIKNRYLAAHPGQALDVVQTSERTQKDFLGHVTYQYQCNGVVKLNPVYQLKDSPACGLDQ